MLVCVIIVSYLRFSFILSLPLTFSTYSSSDTEWELETITGTGQGRDQVVLKGGPYSDNTFDDYVGQTCVQDDLCYKITVHDIFGDGYVNKRKDSAARQ